MACAIRFMRPGLLLPLLVLMVPSGLRAQRFEITPYIGIKSTGATRVDATNPLGVSRLEFDRGASYGLGFLYNVHDLVGLEFLWNRQDSQVGGLLPDGTSVPQTADASLVQFHGVAQIHTAGIETATRPYLVLGVGATRFGGGDRSATLLSYTVGLGLKHYFTDRLGVRIQGRWTPSYIPVDPEGDFCGYLTPDCLMVPERQVMSQGDYTLGVIYKF